MRATLLCVFLALASINAARGQDTIQWIRDLESAKRIAAGTNRPVLIHFWAPSCQPCLKLDQEVYSRPEVKRALEAAFVPVRLNAEEYRATASIYGVDRWPSDVILAPNGQFIARVQCPTAANQYLAQLELLARGSTPTSAPNHALAAQGALAAPNIAGAPGMDVRPASARGAQSVAPQQFAAQQATQSPTDRVANYDFRNVDYGQARASEMRGAAYADAPFTAQAPQAGASTTTAPSAIGSNASAGVSWNSAPLGAETAGGERVAPAVVERTQQAPAMNGQQPLTLQFEMVAAADAPPLGMDGFCPMALRKEGNRQGRWVKGDPRYGVVHRGRTYLFSGPAEQQEFLRDPDRYSPVMAGNDPVLALDFGQHVPGQRKIGRYFGDRVYMFASEETLAKFLGEVEASQAQSRPNRYVEAIYQAENPGRGMLR
jgi:protein disulfide-isomerase